MIVLLSVSSPFYIIKNYLFTNSTGLYHKNILLKRNLSVQKLLALSTLSKPINKKTAKQDPSVQINTGPVRIENLHPAEWDGDGESYSEECYLLAKCG